MRQLKTEVRLTPIVNSSHAELSARHQKFVWSFVELSQQQVVDGLVNLNEIWKCGLQLLTEVQNAYTKADPCLRRDWTTLYLLLKSDNLVHFVKL